MKKKNTSVGDMIIRSPCFEIHLVWRVLFKNLKCLEVERKCKEFEYFKMLLEKTISKTELVRSMIRSMM
jgi:hypothetical protein